MSILTNSLNYAVKQCFQMVLTNFHKNLYGITISIKLVYLSTGFEVLMTAQQFILVRLYSLCSRFKKITCSVNFKPGLTLEPKQLWCSVIHNWYFRVGGGDIPPGIQNSDWILALVKPWVKRYQLKLSVCRSQCSHFISKESTSSKWPQKTSAWLGV